MTNIPERVRQQLDSTYERLDKKVVGAALSCLGIDAPAAFVEFYECYEGPFWSEDVPYELLDLVSETRNILEYTMLCRQQHNFPPKYLVLSELSANAALILDTESSKVFEVDFEGGDQMLLEGDLPERWTTFEAFLTEYFCG